jgi:D-3-phosphoglycerate dehydrogenase
MVGQISTLLASASLNIAELLNKSRGEYAYTLIDTDGSVDSGLIDKVRSISGVLAARVI